jgi:transcriptional regulator with XRE-family HTH domain
MEKVDKGLKEKQKKVFAHRLQIALRRKNIKPADLSAMTGIDKGSISNYVNGRFLPKQDKIYLMSSVLDVNPTWLWAIDVMSGKGEIDPLEGLGGFSVPLANAFPTDSEQETPKSITIVSTEPWDVDAAFTEQDADDIRILARGMMKGPPEKRKLIIDMAKQLFAQDFDEEGNKRNP